MRVIETHTIWNTHRAQLFEACLPKVRKAFHTHVEVNRLVNEHLFGRITMATLNERLIAMLLDENEILRNNLYEARKTINRHEQRTPYSKEAALA